MASIIPPAVQSLTSAVARMLENIDAEAHYGDCLFGVCTDGFEARSDPKGAGVGSDAFSWGVCGMRQEKTHRDDETTFGGKWKNGDVIGFALDMRDPRAAVMRVSVNGSFTLPNGHAFTIDAPFLSPALSAASGCYIVNFGQHRFMHAPPDQGEGYIPVADFAASKPTAAPEFCLRVLEFRRRVAALGRSRIGDALCDVSAAYMNAGDARRALEYASEARDYLRIWLTPTHPFVRRADALFEAAQAALVPGAECSTIQSITCTRFMRGSAGELGLLVYRGAEWSESRLYKGVFVSDGSSDPRLCPYTMHFDRFNTFVANVQLFGSRFYFEVQVVDATHISSTWRHPAFSKPEGCISLQLDVGPSAQLITGDFEESAELCNGRPVYYRRAGANMVMRHVYSETGVGMWAVQLVKSTGDAWTAAKLETSKDIADCEGRSSKWRVFDGKRFVSPKSFHSMSAGLTMKVWRRPQHMQQDDVDERSPNDMQQGYDDEACNKKWRDGN